MPWFGHLSFCASCATFLACRPRQWLHHDMQFIHFIHHHPSYTLIISVPRLRFPLRTISPSLQADRDEHFSSFSFHGAHTLNLHSSYSRITPATPGPQIAFGLLFSTVFQLAAMGYTLTVACEIRTWLMLWYCLRSRIRTCHQVLGCEPSLLQALVLVRNRSSTSRIYCFSLFFREKTSAAFTETSAACVSEILPPFRDSTALGVSHLVLENNFCCPACRVLYVGIAKIVHSGMFYRIQWTVLARQDTDHLADGTNVNSHWSCQCQCMISRQFWFASSRCSALSRLRGTHLRNLHYYWCLRDTWFAQYDLSIAPR